MASALRRASSHTGLLALPQACLMCSLLGLLGISSRPLPVCVYIVLKPSQEMRGGREDEEGKVYRSRAPQHLDVGMKRSGQPETEKEWSAR